MEIPKQLTDYLDQNNVEYEILHHAEAVTAQRIPGRARQRTASGQGGYDKIW